MALPSVRLKWAEITFIVLVSLQPGRCASIFFEEPRKIGRVAKADFKGDGGLDLAVAGAELSKPQIGQATPPF